LRRSVVTALIAAALLSLAASAVAAQRAVLAEMFGATW